MKKIILIISIISLFGCAHHKQAICKHNTHNKQMLNSEIEVPSVTQFPQNTQTFYLENGMEVLAIQNDASPMVCLNMSVRVGSAYENYSTSGMSHMLEHLLFNGTEQRTQDELYEETDFYGMYSNAFTGKFFTDYFLLMPSEYLENGMDVQSDMLFNSIIPEEKFEKERGIVIEEIRKDRDRNEYEIQNYFDRKNFGDSGVGLPTLGTPNTIENLNRDDVYDFFKNHYVPNNMLLTVIGSFDETQLKLMLENNYGQYQPMPVEFYQPVSFAPSMTVNQTNFETDRIHGQIVFDAPAFSKQYSLETEFLIDVLTEELNTTLGDYSPYVSYTNYPSFGKVIIDFTASAEENPSDILVKFDDELSLIQQRLSTIITAEMISLKVNEMIVEEASLLDQLHYYPMMKAPELAMGGGEFVLSKLQNIRELNPLQIIEAGEKLLISNRHYNFVFPKGLTTKDTKDTKLVYDKTVLPSGVTLVTASGGGSEMFGMHILIKNRNVIEGPLSGGAEILHSLLESGTDEYSAEELQKKLQTIGAKIKFKDMGFIPYDNYYNSPEFGYIRFECLEKDAEEGIKLLTHMLSNTILAEENIGEGISNARMRLGMQQSTARETASKEFWRLFLGNNHPSIGKVSGTMEAVSMMNIDNLTSLQKRYFLPENYIISISSGISHSELTNIFNSIWTKVAEPTKKFDSGVELSTDFSEKIIDMSKEQAQIRLGYKFEIEKDDKPTFSLMTDLLSYRMMFDLRETQGLAYSLGMSDGYEGNIGWLTASIGTGIENIDIATNGMKSYFNPDKLLDISQNEIEKTINSSKGHYMMRNLTRIGQAFYMGYFEFYSDDYQKALNRFEKYEKITVEDIQKVAEKYLQFPENHTLVIVK
ncbi:MAG: insulinase family protein [Candidatus Marinimicrobia bacterium]|nr:insulinase family protein [Candidatus Neomarinimicrobiota bacterium]MBL7022572.1 insulinase family protein [Candidatus Neomarinimicrobiota bacterium]MBL7108928.1 insulinase family protein [Candidatus Neomarinimicrobiota bacterium]